jgi:hypothetical protein
MSNQLVTHTHLSKKAVIYSCVGWLAGSAIALMIPHDRMAMMMSAMVLDSAERPKLQNFARSTSEHQQAEVEQMQQWYQTWER